MRNLVFVKRQILAQTESLWGVFLLEFILTSENIEGHQETRFKIRDLCVHALRHQNGKTKKKERRAPRSLLHAMPSVLSTY